MVRCRPHLAFTLLVCAAASCAQVLPPFHFAGTDPPTAENQALCRSVCERAACRGSVLEACQTDCKRPRDDFLPCEYPWRTKLLCQQRAADLACDPGGGVFAPTCRAESLNYVHCTQVQ